MTVLGKFNKQPQEVLDYDVDFSEWFSNRQDQIASFSASAQSGLTVLSSALAGNVVKLVISGGTDGTSYKVTVRVTTTLSLVKEADFLIRVKEV